VSLPTTQVRQQEQDIQVLRQQNVMLATSKPTHDVEAIKRELAAKSEVVAGTNASQAHKDENTLRCAYIALGLVFSLLPLINNKESFRCALCQLRASTKFVCHAGHC
jgi:hypothetical protein